MQTQPVQAQSAPARQRATDPGAAGLLSAGREAAIRKIVAGPRPRLSELRAHWLSAAARRWPGQAWTDRLGTAVLGVIVTLVGVGVSFAVLIVLASAAGARGMEPMLSLAFLVAIGGSILLGWRAAASWARVAADARAERAALSGQCMGCDYDLTGVTHVEGASVRCPECGIINLAPDVAAFMLSKTSGLWERAGPT